MDIKGFIRNSFVDWDGKVSAVIFLPGCTFRCGYCYNKPMVTGHEKIDSIDFRQVEEHLGRNRGFVDGVVITGGEPTIHDDLPVLIGKIRSMGYAVKLDTNGSNPEMLRKIISGKMVDYIAMDIKAPLSKYSQAAGVSVDSGKIRKSIDLIKSGGIDYEFRTTVIPSFHGEDDIEDMARSISGAGRYVLQKFVPKETIDARLMCEPSPTSEYMERMKKAAEKHVASVILRE